MKNTIRLKLEGTRERNLHPGAVDIRTVASLLGYLHQIANAYGLKDEPRQPLIALSEIFEGSAGYVFNISPTLAPILDDVIGFVANKPNAIEPKAYEVLVHLQEKVLKKNGYELTLISDVLEGSEAPTGVINPDIPLPDLPHSIFVTGKTTMLGVCVNSGGKSPRLDFQPDGSRRTFHLHVPFDVAKNAGKKLYERVAIRGMATWNSLNWEVVKFEFEALMPYEKGEIKEGLRKLHKIIGEDFSNIGDSGEWLEKVRNG
jgi:hypothetical protein